MARPKLTGDITISQLENMLNNRRNQLNQLVRDRKKAQKRLDQIDRQISQLNGRGMTSGGRARNAKSLVATMEGILKAGGKPMPVGDIVDAVLRSGYKTTSANFRGIVNQTLIKEKLFTSAGRGLYQLKK